MRILLTRPADEAERTRARLEALGHAVRVAPVITIEPTGAAWPQGVVDAIVATSARAFVPNTCDGVPREARTLVPLWMVGERTTTRARQAGFLGGATTAPTAAALAAMPLPPRRRVVYLAGRERKPDLEVAWAARGLSLDVVETYAARPAAFSEATLAALENGTIDAVLHYSRRSAELFLAEAGTERATRAATHIAISDDVASALTPAGLRVVVARRPDEAAVLDALASGTDAT